MEKPIVVGVVLYDPKVAVIWDIIRDFFESRKCPVDTVFYTNYELQVEALIQGHVDIAWNSPLAWLDAQRRSGGRCRAIAMRDTDQSRVTHIVVKRSGGCDSLDSLRGKTIAFGAKDSPQATLIPIGFLEGKGLKANRDFQVRRFDLLVGKHGDHIGGELEAFRALQKDEAQASAMMDLNWETWTQDGTIDPVQFKILATTEPYDHCVFTVREDFPEERERKWLEVLFSMSYDNPQHREMMDLEGLREWKPGRTTGFGGLADSVSKLDYFEQD